VSNKKSIFFDSTIHYTKLIISKHRLTPLSGTVIGFVCLLFVVTVLGVVLGLIPVYKSGKNTKTTVFLVTQPTTTSQTTTSPTTTPQGALTSNKNNFFIRLKEAFQNIKYSKSNTKSRNFG